MNAASLIGRNLTRRKLRTTLLLATIAVAFFIYGALSSFESAFTSEDAAGNRLIVMNSASSMSPLPQNYQNKIEAIPGAAEVGHASWFGAYYRDRKNDVLAFAVQPEGWLRQHPELLVERRYREQFFADRAGLLVGEGLAQKFGWKVGDKVTLGSVIHMRAGMSPWWEFNISGTFRGETDGVPSNYVMLSHEYLDAGRAYGKSTVGWFVVTPQTANASDAVALAIDTSFANSSWETTTTTEDAFFRAFSAQFGDVRMIVTSIVSAAFAAILLVVGNTIVMAVRERTREIAVLKCVGFSHAAIILMVLGESMSLALFGGALGIALAAMGVWAVQTAYPALLPSQLSLSLATLWTGGLMALGLGLIAGLLPAVYAARLNVREGLGR